MSVSRSTNQWENCSSILEENVPCSETTQVKAVDVALFMFACLLATFVCTGNLLAILSIWKTPSLRTLPNLYVASLAAADFVVGLGTVVLALFLLPAVRVQLFYRYINLCVLMHGINLGMIAVSVLHMTLISIDRFLYINRPYVYERVVTVRLVIVCLTGIWMFGVFYSMVPQFTYKPYGLRPICDITMRLPIEYLFFTSASLYFSLASIIILMYSLILRTAFRQQNAVGANHVTQVQGENQASRKSTLKGVKFFMIVFGVFFVCLTPVVVCLGFDYYSYVPGPIYRFLNLVALTNSGMNFVIYAILKKQFRQALFKILCPCACGVNRKTASF